MNVSVFKNLKISKVTGVETIDSILQKIKNGCTMQQVLLARAYGKGTPEYDKVKAEIETFTPNAEFREKRAVVNLVALSGYIYLDVDNYTDRSTFTQMPYIYACWASLSGTGLGALARIDGLCANNFKAVWLYLEDYFKQQGVTIDTLTKDISRQNVISYDPDIFINRDCAVLDANEVVSSNSTVVNQLTYQSSLSQLPTLDYVSSLTRDNTTYTSSCDSMYHLIYQTTLPDYKGQPYVVIPEGKDYRGAYLPKSIGDGKRHFWLSKHIITLLFNNPVVSYEELETELLMANSIHCNPRLEARKVISLTKWYYNKHSSNCLTIIAKKKKIWINPSSDLTTAERRAIIGKEVGNLRRMKTLNTIQLSYDSLKLINEKVTQKMVREVTGLSLRTIKSRWNEIKK